MDIGGTKVAAGVVDADGHILGRLRRDTPAQNPDKVEDVIADCIRELAAEHEVEAAGLGAAGFVDAARSTVLFAPNLAWRNEPLRAASSNARGCRWWSRTTPMPPPGPRPASGPATVSPTPSP